MTPYFLHDGKGIPMLEDYARRDREERAALRPAACEHRAPLVNVRDWPDLGLRIGECPACNSTITVR